MIFVCVHRRRSLFDGILTATQQLLQGGMIYHPGSKQRRADQSSPRTPGPRSYKVTRYKSGMDPVKVRPSVSTKMPGDGGK